MRGEIFFVDEVNIEYLRWTSHEHDGRVADVGDRAAVVLVTVVADVVSVVVQDDTAADADPGRSVRRPVSMNSRRTCILCCRHGGWSGRSAGQY